MGRRRIGLGLLLIAAFALGVRAPVSAGATPSGFTLTASPALSPAFSIPEHNYVTACANQPVSLNVTVPSGTSVTVDAQPKRTGPVTFTTHVNLQAGQEFLIRWSGVPNPYHVRCLPAGFPTWSFAQGSVKPQALDVAVTASSNTGSGFTGSYVVVFDDHGVPRWWHGVPATASTPWDATVLPNGDIAWIDGGLTGPQGVFTEYSLSGGTVRTFPPGGAWAAKSTDFHDLQLLPNGNYFLAVESPKTVTLSGGTCGVAAPKTEKIADPIIQELSSTGQLLWSWDANAHIPLSEVDAPWYSNCLATTGPGDPYHYNGIQPLPDGNIAVSFRHLDAFYEIRVSPGKAGNGAILWKVGGTATRQSLKIAGDPVHCPAPSVCQDFRGQHDPRIWFDPASGKMYSTIHDNGTNGGRPPRALRFLIDPSTKTATVVETVSDVSVTSSSCCGSARKLPGGDWLVSWGSTNVVEELPPNNTSSSAYVYKLTFANGVFSYRAYPVMAGSTKYGTGYSSALDAGMDAQYPRNPQG